MKKGILAVFILMMLLMLSGCNPLVDASRIPESYSVYASFLPAYMIADMIITDEIENMNLHLLVQPQDGCMRDYGLSDWEMYMVMNADAVILIGNGLESFESALYSLGEEGPAVISASSSLVLDCSGASDLEESHLNGANPWLFLSVEGAVQLAEAITANMIGLDPDYESAYMKNLYAAYESLETLKSDMSDRLKDCDKSIPIALAHEGLIYLAEENRLNVTVRLDREPGVMPDDNELKKIMETLSQSGAQAVLIEKQAPEALIAALEEAGYRVALIDTLSTGSCSGGAQAYIERMTKNAEAICEVLRK